MSTAIKNLHKWSGFDAMKIWMLFVANRILAATNMQG